MIWIDSQHEQMQSMIQSKIQRPEGYLEERANRWRFHLSGSKLKAYIEDILASPRSSVKKIVDGWLDTVECYDWIARSEVDPVQHVVIRDDDEEDNEVVVIHQEYASDFLSEAIDGYHLSCKLSDGIEIESGSIKTFDQLYDLLAKANPWWLIEMCFIFCGYGDAAHCYPDDKYDYEVTDSEVSLIRAEILQHLDKMKDIGMMSNIPQMSIHHDS